MDQQTSSIAGDEPRDTQTATSAPGADPSKPYVNGVGLVKAPATQDAFEIATQPENAADSSALSNAASTFDLPILDRAWRDSPANKSYGHLLERMAQQCYTDLAAMMGTLDQIAVSKAAQANGVGIASREDSDVGSLKKKRVMVDFSRMWRDRFIKALIISDWIRNAGDGVAKIIDVRNTLKERDVLIDRCLNGVGDLKRETSALCGRPHNIAGAMQYMGTGKSSYPSLSYLKPPRLSADDIIRLHNDMAAWAKFRILSYEYPPPYYMQEHEAHDGRITFKVPGEFEVDLAVVDELPEAGPWYFVDFRISVSPRSSITASTRVHFEQQINAATASKGLQGCYDWCHNFILNHRISEMEDQAYKLLKGKFFDTLKIERIRGHLCIQYWTGRPGRKSWIELQTHSGQGRFMPHVPTVPVNVVRWHKNGELMEEEIPCDWAILDLEKLLMTVCSMHTTRIMSRLKMDLGSKVHDRDILSYVFEDVKDASNDILTLSLPSAHASCTQRLRLNIDRITGQWRITPTTPPAKTLLEAVAKGTKALNADSLEELICITMLEGVVCEADLRGWTSMCNLRPRANRKLRDLFSDAPILSLWTVPEQRGWLTEWAIGYTVSLRSTQWWLVRYSGSIQEPAILEAHDLKPENLDWDDIGAHVERVAMAKVKSLILDAQKPNPGISYQYVLRPGAKLTQHHSISAGSYFIEVAELMKNDLSMRRQILSWARDPIRISSGDFHYHTSTTREYLTITTKPGRLESLREYLRHNESAFLVMNEDDSIMAQFESPLNEDVWTGARRTLVSITRLDKYLKVIARLGLRCNALGTESLALAYGDGLSARLSFPTRGHDHIRLRLEPADSNPHHCVRRSLESLMNQGHPDKAFDTFAHTLLFTLPLLTTINALSAADANSPAYFFFARTATSYLLKYRAIPSVAFKVRARQRQVGATTTLLWQIEQLPTEKAGRSVVDWDTSKALRDFFSNPGPGCQALNNGFTAGADSVVTAIEKLHGIVIHHIAVVGFAQPSSEMTAEQAPEQASRVAESNTNQDVIMLD